MTYCQDGQHVLRTLLAPDTVKPHLLVLDLNMPIMDGHETLSRLRNHPALLHYPVVVLTSSDEVSDITRAYDQHASLYLVKALHLPDFMDQLEAEREGFEFV